MHNHKLTVINLWGGPGTGKSTTAAGLFNIMKLKKHNVELVTEYAKQMVWERQHHSVFQNQILMLAKQDQKQRVLVDQMDYCITDSPILMGLSYAPEGYYKNFEPLIKEVFDSYTNINIFLRRVKEYNPKGRNQNEDEAKGKDVDIKTLLDKHGIQYHIVDADEHAHLKIYELIFGNK